MIALHSLPSTSLKSLLILSLSTLSPLLAQAHSWLDCSDTRDNGACFGYPLGYPSRNDVDINTKYTYLVQNRRPDAPVCQPGRQNISGNNPFPAANVVPGQSLHLTWQPDGHLDDANPSTVEIHWSGVAGKQLWTRSELGPNTHLASMTFATSSNCDIPREPNTWCHGHFTVPEWTQPGTYQMIWWWKYDRNPAGEEYSTCFEINVNYNGPHPASGPQLQTQVQRQERAQPQEQIQAQSQGREALAVPQPTPDLVQALIAKSLSYTDDDPAVHPASVDTATPPASLSDMVTQADAPLAGIPSPDYHASTASDGYLGDDDGLLAVDAINMDNQAIPHQSPESPSNILRAGIQQDQRAPTPSQHAASEVNTTATASVPSPPSPSASSMASTSPLSHSPSPSPTGSGNGRILNGNKPKALPAPKLSSAAVEMSQVSWAVLLASTMAFMAFMLS
ncbi:hypothetical protein BGZ73_000339 [Actinomortierella ambigua]|nr:hypothetical protein BGZ73_000339 [Actinomortierella ambigua]